ncbi:MAG: MFS transporter [Acidimicrobiales bacterium]|nr:MFS transporter [Acidimicrobiales bacterium]OUW87271.1 MAG: MFS transporter [Acidimicrobiaceae bacterium TMED224]
MSDHIPDRDAIQKRTVRVLQQGVVPGGLAMGTSYSVAALLGSEITGSDTLGAIAAVGLSIGQSFAGIPVAVLMAKRGRRIGIGTAYLVGAMGATCALFAALTETYLLLVVGMTLCGCGQAGNLAARYAGSDLATDRDRGRSISLVVWGNTVGSVLGPTVGLGLRSLAGTSEGGSGFIFSYMVSITLFIVASGVILRRLRPDPLLLVANASDTAIRGPRFSDLGLIFSHPAARIALLGMMLSQGVMVGVMTVTPLHMRDGNQEPLIIGLMISLHIVGMYAFSPWIGRIADRISKELLIGIGAVITALGSEVASHTDASDVAGHFIGLFLIGIGWCSSLVAGSALMTQAFPTEVRVATQSTADVLMTATGAAAGISSGLAVEQRSYHDLAHWAALVSVCLAVVAAIAVIQGARVRETVTQDD